MPVEFPVAPTESAGSSEALMMGFPVEFNASALHHGCVGNVVTACAFVPLPTATGSPSDPPIVSFPESRRGTCVSSIFSGNPEPSAGAQSSSEFFAAELLLCSVCTRRGATTVPLPLTLGGTGGWGGGRGFLGDDELDDDDSSAPDAAESVGAGKEPSAAGRLAMET